MPRKPKIRPPASPHTLDLADAGTAAALAELEQVQRKAVDTYLGPDPWPLMRDLAYTVDEIDGQVKKFPDKPYLQHMAGVMLREKHLLIMKSRRMLQTWQVMCFAYWFARRTPNALICLAARKEGKSEMEGSAGLVTRVKQIHEHLLPVLPAIELETHFCYARFPNGATILGIGEGPDQMRQLTCTLLVADEFAHWQWPYESFQAMQPTTRGGGRLIILSSAGLGFFADAAFDRFATL